MRKLKGQIIMRLALPAFALLWSLWLVQPVEVSAQDEPVRTAINEDLTIEKGEVVQGDVSVTNGDLIVLGEVIGDAVVVNGDTRIAGKVDGDVFVTRGDLELSQGSTVGRNVVVAAGEISREEGSTVQGTVSKWDIPLTGIGNFAEGEHWGKPWGGIDGSVGPFERLFGLAALGMFSLLVLALGAGISSLMPNRVRLASETLIAGPGPSLVVGLITAFLLWPIVGMVGMVLTISVVGIVLVPVLVLGVVVALLFGLVVVSNWLGRRLYQTGYPSAANSTPQLVVQVLLGMAVLLGSTLVPAAFVAPWVGWLMMALVYFAACVGLGSVILSRLGTLPPPRRVPVAASNPQGPANTAPLGPTPVFPPEHRSLD